MKNKCEENENKVILGDVMDNGLKDLWRRDNPDSPEFICYDRSSGTLTQTPA